jgi:hypothetical protein
MPKLPPPDSIKNLELAFDRFLFAPTRWAIQWAEKAKFSADLTQVQKAKAGVENSAREAAGYAAGDAMRLTAARTSKATALGHVANTAKQAVHDYFAPLTALSKAVGFGKKAAKPVVEEVLPAAADLVDDVAHQHLGNWAQTVQESKRGVVEIANHFKR